MGAESGLRRRVKGLSEAEFGQRFGTAAQCRSALFQLRWGQGWACPGCGHGGYAELKGRAVYQCNRCKRQVGLTAGTVFHWTIDRAGQAVGDDVAAGGEVALGQRRDLLLAEALDHRQPQPPGLALGRRLDRGHERGLAGGTAAALAALRSVRVSSW